MCIISFHFKEHPKYKLIIAANRDEFYERPTEEAHFWEDEPSILAGRDLKEKGTWLGITKQGRIAALTNYRDLNLERPNKISRGKIITSFLTSKASPRSFLEELDQNKNSFNGFNVLVGTPDELYYYGNRKEEIIPIEPGTYSLSNRFLNSPWPKVNKAKNKLHEYVMNHEQMDIEELFIQLNDREIAPDEDLPDTGVGLELESQLSPIFIQTEKYGTRSSTVILVSHENEVTFVERTYNSGSFKKEKKFEFDIKKSA